MATDPFNGVRLRYELSARGEVPLVLVHGGWGSHRQWLSATPDLAKSFRVLSYDRRGHSESEHPSGPLRLADNVADLAALIEGLELAPAYVAGNSFGGVIALRLAGERPDLLRGVLVHEPPLHALLTDDPAAAPILEEIGNGIVRVMERIASGDPRDAAEGFTDQFFAPGEWTQLGREYQETAIGNAPTVLNELQDPNALEFDAGSIAAFSRPVQITTGENSSPLFAPILEKLSALLKRAERLTFPDAGHLPHATHPADYAQATTAFIRKYETG